MKILLLMLTIIAPSLRGDPLINHIERGLKSNFDMQAEKYKRQNLHDEGENAFYNFFPPLELSASKNFSYSVDHSVDTPATSTWSESLGVSSSLTLYDNGRRWRDYKQGKVERQMDQIASDERIENYVMRVIDAYMQYQLLLNQQKILKQNHQNVEWTYDKSLELVKLGAKTPLETSDLEIELATSKRDQEEMAQRVSMERSKYIFLLDPHASVLSIPVENILHYTPYFVKRYRSHMDKIEKAGELDLTHNLSERQSQLQKWVATSSLAGAERDFWPEITARVSYDLNLSSYIGESEGPTQDLGASLGLGWKFFDWGKDLRSLKIKRRNLMMSALESRKTAFNLKLEAKNLVNNLKNLRQSIKITQMIVNKSKRNLESNRALYSLGKITRFELQTAGNRLFQSHNELASRMVNLYTLYAQILLMEGKTLKP